MSLRILKSGLQSTIQDLGRTGFSHYGISKSGAADSVSLRLGNILVGNPESAAGIEMTLLGDKILFEDKSYVALTGSRFNAKLDGDVAPWGKGFNVKAGQKLEMGYSKKGARSYLCVRGGLDISNYLSGKTTHVMSKIGGLKGRPFKNGDVIKFCNDSTNLSDPKSFNNLLKIDTSIIHINKGLQGYLFSESAWNQLTTKTFKVSDSFSRMGIRLIGNPIEHDTGSEIITEGIPLGAIQIPNDGNPIISFVEHQTTGGYPKIANVITADLYKVGQLKPGDVFKFKKISIEKAEILRLEQESYIKSLKAT